MPIENTTGGGIAETLDAFAESAGEVTVYAEVALTIRHNLLANCEPREIEAHLLEARSVRPVPQVAVHAVPPGQPRRLGELFPGGAGRRQRRAPRRRRRGLRPRRAPPRRQRRLREHRRQPQQHHPLLRHRPHGRPTLGRRQDLPDVHHRPRTRAPSSRSSAPLRTAASISPTSTNAPSRKENWNYTFFIDALGHVDEPGMSQAITAARRHCQELWVLGSYPRAQRIL